MFIRLWQPTRQKSIQEMSHTICIIQQLINSRYNPLQNSTNGHFCSARRNLWNEGRKDGDVWRKRPRWWIGSSSRQGTQGYPYIRNLLFRQFLGPTDPRQLRAQSPDQPCRQIMICTSAACLWQLLQIIFPLSGGHFTPPFCRKAALRAVRHV